MPSSESDPIPEEPDHWTFTKGDMSMTLTFSDYLDGLEKFMHYHDREPDLLFANTVAISQLKADKNFIQETDLIMTDEAVNTLTRLAIYRKNVRDGIGLLDGKPVYRTSMEYVDRTDHPHVVDKVYPSLILESTKPIEKNVMVVG